MKEGLVNGTRGVVVGFEKNVQGMISCFLLSGSEQLHFKGKSNSDSFVIVAA